MHSPLPVASAIDLFVFALGAIIYVTNLMIGRQTNLMIGRHGGGARAPPTPTLSIPLMGAEGREPSTPLALPLGM